MLKHKFWGFLVIFVLILAACKPQGAAPSQTPEPDAETRTAQPDLDEDRTEETETPPETTDTGTPPIGLIPSCDTGSWTSPVDGARIICVPNGDFPMGALADDPQAEADEKPLHTQEMSNFWLYETEVTNAMFGHFVEAAGYTTTAEANGYSHTYLDGAWIEMDGADWMHPQGPGSDLADKMDHPVVNVSWEDAQNYCTWSNDGYLPMEKDWEKAARGQGEHLYPWGDAPPSSDHVNGPGEPYATTAPVFKLAVGASPYGLLHMSGNAAEWISHRFNPDYFTTGLAYPEGEGYPQQVRGGGWLSETRELRISDRQPLPPEVQSADFIGFRCMLSYLPPTPVSAGGNGGAASTGGDAPTQACEITISPAYEAEMITETDRSRLDDYALEGDMDASKEEGSTAEQEASLADYWEEQNFTNGIFLPGWQTNIKYDSVDGQRVFLYVFLMDGGIRSPDAWFMFEFWENATLAMAQDSSIFLFFNRARSGQPG